MSRELVVVVSSDVVGPRMAGPAIRAVELARVLSRTEKVVLTAPQAEPWEGSEGLDVVSFRRVRLRKLIREAKVVISQGLGVPLRPLLTPGHALVLDFYDPNPVELLAHYRHHPRREARRAQEYLRHRLLALARRGDCFLYATERQRHFWLGLLAGAGRLSWEADKSHPNLDDLMVSLPFGLSQDPPQAPGPVLKGVWPGIGRQDKVLIWGGGVWNWFDPLTVIRAVAQVARKIPEIRLFFLGVSHPNPAIPAMAMVSRAVELARELGLLDEVVFFNHGWVDYEERAGFLLESDLSVLASGRDLETDLAFRTRLLDSLWAGLPMVLTEGDYFAELVKAQELGRVVRPGDDAAMAGAIIELLGDEAHLDRCRANIKRLAGEMTWPQVARPLVEFCAQPRFHPGAARRPGQRIKLLAGYAWGLAQVVGAYGGAGEYLARRAAMARKKRD